MNTRMKSKQRKAKEISWGRMWRTGWGKCLENGTNSRRSADVRKIRQGSNVRKRISEGKCETGQQYMLVVTSLTISVWQPSGLRRFSIAVICPLLMRRSFYDFCRMLMIETMTMFFNIAPDVFRNCHWQMLFGYGEIYGIFFIRMVCRLRYELWMIHWMSEGWFRVNEFLDYSTFKFMTFLFSDCMLQS